MSYFIFFDHNGIIKYLTPSMKSLLDYESVDLIGKSGSVLIPQDDFLKSMALTVESDSFVSVDADLKLRCKSGAWCSVRGSWVALAGLSETAVILICAVAESAHHSAVSGDNQPAPLFVVDRLIAQISHDVRNPLATAQEALFLLKSVAPDEGDIVQYLLWLENALKSIIDTVLNIHNPFLEYSSRTTMGAPTCT